jgi:RimJ/RimL family protein N-acetyltransferase
MGPKIEITAMFPLTRQTKTNKQFTIRPAEPIDKPDIIDNINTIAAEEIYLQTNQFVLTPDWDDVLNDSINLHKGQLLIIPTIDQHVIGHLRLFAGNYGERDRHVGSIGLALLAPYRNLGIGTILLEYALQWSRTAAFEKLEADVIASNLRALELFRKFDFVVEGVRQQQLKIRERYEDELILARSMASFH